MNVCHSLVVTKKIEFYELCLGPWLPRIKMVLYTFGLGSVCRNHRVTLILTKISPLSFNKITVSPWFCQTRHVSKVVFMSESLSHNDFDKKIHFCALTKSRCYHDFVKLVVYPDAHFKRILSTTTKNADNLTSSPNELFSFTLLKE